MIDLIEAISTDDAIMERFCSGCPRVMNCPADNEPFCYTGRCLNGNRIETIKAATLKYIETLEDIVRSACSTSDWD